jgi:LemA protein
MKNILVIGAVIVIILLLVFVPYFMLIGRSESVDAQWAQVENVYQRRADLVPNLVETVKGYASHEQEIFTAVADARSKIGQINIDVSNLTAEQLTQFQTAQGEFSQALSRLIALSEAYPDLKASQNFLALQSQLEGTENRITVERGRYNEVVRSYNVLVKMYFISGMFGYTEKPYFQSEPGSSIAPTVKF